MKTRTSLILISLASAAILAAPLTAQRRAGGDRDPVAAFAKADTNGDGTVSRAEYAAARMARFDRLDRNGDGAISRDDFGRLIRLAPRMGKRIDALLAAADTNHDGRVSRAEYAAAPMPLFDRLDSNKDGVIDKRELAAAQAYAADIREELETYR